MTAEEFRRHTWRAMSEEEFLQQVRALAHALGWKTYHTRDSRRSDEGFLDLLMVRDKRLLVAELKREDRHLTPQQEAWLTMLEATGKVETYLWFPHDIDAIEGILMPR